MEMTPRHETQTQTQTTARGIGHDDCGDAFTQTSAQTSLHNPSAKDNYGPPASSAASLYGLPLREATFTQASSGADYNHDAGPGSTLESQAHHWL